MVKFLMFTMKQNTNQANDYGLHDPKYKGKVHVSGCRRILEKLENRGIRGGSEGISSDKLILFAECETCSAHGSFAEDCGVDKCRGQVMEDAMQWTVEEYINHFQV